MWIRDLEGTKLLPEFWPSETLQQLSEQADNPVYYSREQGWNRIGYCTFINNISEAIFFIATGDTKLEVILWELLKESIVRWQSINGKQPELVALLDMAASSRNEQLHHSLDAECRQRVWVTR
ncbi:ferric iron reductase [Vibrio chagasii]|nr:ferric iron reductase [Vibrio chagasii]